MQEFGRELWRNKWWVLLLSGLLAGLFIARTYKQIVTYKSSLTFLVSSNNAKPSNPALGELLGLGGVGYELDKIVELARSRRIITQVLLKKVRINDKEDYIANHIIDIYHLQNKWAAEVGKYKDINLSGFYFTHSKETDFSSREHRALNLLHDIVAGSTFNNVKGIMVVSYDKKTDMVRLNVEPQNEELSSQLLDLIYIELNDFYVEETVGRPREALANLTLKADSLQVKLNNQERQLALEKDRSEGLISRASSLVLDQLDRRVQTTNRHYETVLNNKEKLEYILSTETPTFQVIDRTFIPIENKSSRLKALLIGGFLGGFLAIGYFIGRKIIRDAMA